MNYLPRNRSRSGYYRPLMFLAALFIIGAIVFYFLGGVLVSVVSPLWRAENTVARTFANLTNVWHSRQALLAENERLKERLASLEFELSARPNAEGESMLLSLLGRQAEEEGITAAALIRPPQTPYDILVVDAGSDEAVRTGASVSLPEGPLLGTVVEVLSHTSKVRLFSAPDEKTSAVLERHGVAVMLEGTGGGNFKIIVPRETAVVIGDRILSADISSRLLAVVGEINLEPTDSFKEVLAKSPANIFSIRFVKIEP